MKRQQYGLKTATRHTLEDHIVVSLPKSSPQFRLNRKLILEVFWASLQAQTSGVGIPQGLVTSSFLCDLYYNSRDNSYIQKAFGQRTPNLLMRWVDDILVLSLDEQITIEQLVDQLSECYGANISPSKTKFGSFELCCDPSSVAEFSYVGIKFTPRLQSGELKFNAQPTNVRLSDGYKLRWHKRSLLTVRNALRAAVQPLLSHMLQRVFLDPILNNSSTLERNRKLTCRMCVCKGRRTCGRYQALQLMSNPPPFKKQLDFVRCMVRAKLLKKGSIARGPATDTETEA
eukprot:Gregarina_sp_Poly_1__6180@NODE_326_length_9503_cov_249_815388_g278_i0_p4_GENE_NODE_326_length_9503_cov_249_815388_g278_i0NODE_326_length_9503_cov_249_815388_g278_i0_p4_ORF_typecomplete_len287_score29_84RVT_1/PF00078_27/5_9e12_NODE_326_length_9503_cov_249_815388_g278_i042815141